MNFILNKMVNNNIINSDEIEEYRYALSVIFFKGLHYLIIFTTGIILNILFQTIIFIYVYTICRSYVGGFHASNPITCCMLSALFIFGLYLIDQVIIILDIVVLLLLLIVSIYIYNICKNTFKHKLSYHLILINILSILLYHLNGFKYLNCILYTFILVIILYYFQRKLSKIR